MSGGHWTDPLGAEDPFPPEGCDCEHGVRRVGPAYAIDLLPGDLPALRLAAAELVGRVAHGEHVPIEEVRAAQKAADTLESNRAFVADSVFPCPRCRHAQYERWRHGCYKPNHNRRACKVCGPNAKTRSDAA